MIRYGSQFEKYDAAVAHGKLSAPTKFITVSGCNTPVEALEALFKRDCRSAVQGASY